MIAPRTSPSIPATPTASPAPDLQPEFVIEVGESRFPVYGDASIGWSIEQRDIAERSPFVYGSLDELVFAVLNLCIQAHGSS